MSQESGFRTPVVSELELLGQRLIAPTRRETPWSFGGVEYDTSIKAEDLFSQRTWGSLRVVLAWDSAPTYGTDGMTPTLRVHQEKLVPLMVENPSRRQLEGLVEICEAHGVFKIKLDPATGLVETCAADENPAMHVNRWVTDSVRTLGLLDSVQQSRVLETLARFYGTPTEQAAFRACIEQPGYYQADRKHGVAHIFQVNGDDLVRDSGWFNNARLESHALALGAFADDLLLGGEPSEAKLHATASLALYLEAIGYATAPSAGCWEEIPFPGGLTWDTEAGRAGFTKLKWLSQERPGVWSRLMESVSRGQWNFATRLGRVGGLDELISQGLDRVRETYLAEAPGRREHDAALVFVAQSPDLKLSDNPLVDLHRFELLLLTLEENLIRNQGMIRYAPFRLDPHDEVRLPDSYLACNYWLALDETGCFNPPRTRLLQEFGSKDASDPVVFRARSALAITDREAEWFMSSDLSRAWSRQVERIRHVRSLDLGDNASLNVAEDLAMRYAVLNLYRSLARITGPGSVKANGMPCPEWSVPEAWEWVRVRRQAVGGGDGFVERSFPGVNTPLAWAQVSLKKALKALAFQL